MQKIMEKIRNLAKSVEDYTKEAITPALPSVAGVNLAKKLISQEKYEEAKNLLLQVTTPDALVYKYLGVAYDKMSDWQNARDAYQKSADMNPNDKDIWAKLGFVLYLTEDFDNARKAFENSDRLRPMHPDVIAGLGMALLKLCHYDQAREKLELAVQLNPKNRMAQLLLGLSHKYLDDHSMANSVLEKLVKTHPDGINTYEYALLKYESDDYKNAEIYCKKSIELFADMQGPYVLLGKIYAQRCERQTALGYFQSAFDRNLNGEELYLGWADAFIRFGEYDAAREKIVEGLKIRPSDLVLRERLTLCDALDGATSTGGNSDLVKGITAYNRGDFQGAIDLLNSNVTEEKDALQCYYLAKSYAEINDFERGCEYFDEAIEKNPMYLQAQQDYVKYLIEKEKFSDARYKLRKMPKTKEVEELQSFVESKL